MSLSKLFQRIIFHNNTTPAINEDNLNAMSKAIDDIDDRVILIGDDVVTVIPQIRAYLEQAEDLAEVMEQLSKNPPYIGANGNWYVWDTNTEDFVDSGIDASITVSIADINLLPVGSTPYVTNTGTSTDPIFHLYIPQTKSITNVVKDGQYDDPLRDQYNIIFNDGTHTSFLVTNGVGIVSITKESTQGLVDTYTISCSDGTGYDFTVTNGATGNGVASITKTGTQGLVDTYTITMTDGTTSTFTVTNGQNGADGVGIPTGGTTGQVLTKKSGSNYDTEWKDASGGSDSVATPIDAVRNNNIDSNFEELSYKHDTQAYIRLYVDDARNDLSDVWAIFQEYGVVANIVVPTNTLENTANNGQKIKDLLHDMEDAGCEIQSHSIDFNPLTANSTREDAIAMLKDSKEALLKEGYKVYGFCRPGGTNEVKFGTKGFGDLVQQYYLYSDDDTVAPVIINQVRAAIGLNATEANIRSIVNQTKAKSPARKIFIHGIGADITEANLRYLITYAQSQNIEFVTDYEYYHTHVIGISDDRLQKIENGDLTPYTTFDHFFFEQCYGRVNYDHSQYPYGLIYSTGSHQLFISDSPIIFDTTGSTGVYKRADGESFKYQRWEYADCQWTMKQSGTVTSFNTLVTGTPLFANFEVVNDSGTVVVTVENYYPYIGTFPKIGNMSKSDYDSDGAVKNGGGIKAWVQSLGYITGLAWSALTGKPFNTVGNGLTVSNNALTADIKTVSLSSRNPMTDMNFTEQDLLVNGVGNAIEGTRWTQATQTLSTSADTTYTFTSSFITTSSVIDVYTDIFGINPSNVVVTNGQCVITFPKQSTAQTMTCRIYVK